MVHKDNQGFISLTVAPHIRPLTNHIVIKYHHFQSFIPNGEASINHVDTKQYIEDIIIKPLDTKLFGYLHYNLNRWWVNGILIREGVLDYTHGAGIL